MQNTIKGLTDRQNNKSKLKKLLIFKFVYKNVKIITSKKYKWVTKFPFSQKQ